MLSLASDAAAAIAQALTQRGVLCNKNKVARRPNLWWLPLIPNKNLANSEVNANA
jgi:hypothetical protein